MADSGPFTLAPGEHMEATLAVTVGNDFEDLNSNFVIAQKLFLNSFLGPSTPPSPKLNGIGGDGKVYLYWDDISEKAVDLVSKKKDFQGYKIYRSQDQGSTWGKQINDSKGNLVGYVPIAQFDKDDLIQGVDPFNNFNYLGDNSGIVHYFIDSTVVNGVNYSYTITAYDSGSASISLESMESSKGTTAADANLIDVTPSTSAIGFKNADYQVTQLSEVGNGLVSIKIVDPAQLSGSDYLLTFNSTPADSFYLINENSSTQILANELNNQNAIIIEGFAISVSGDGATGIIKDIKNQINESVFGEENYSSNGNWFVNQVSTNNSADQLSKGTDYEFRFTSSGSFAGGFSGTR